LRRYARLRFVRPARRRRPGWSARTVATLPVLLPSAVRPGPKIEDDLELEHLGDGTPIFAAPRPPILDLFAPGL
jgi:hypothetical protein